VTNIYGTFQQCLCLVACGSRLISNHYEYTITFYACTSQQVAARFSIIGFSHRAQQLAVYAAAHLVQNGSALEVLVQYTVW
jgi:hypothetical protein